MVQLFVCFVDGLVNTGLGAAGNLDPYWKIVSVPSGTTGFTAGSNAVIMTPKPTWPSSPSWPSKYIGVTADGTAYLPGGTYVYQLSFASASYLSSTVEVYFLVDDAVTSVTVSDGNTTIQTITSFSGPGNGNTWNNGGCFSSFTLSAFGPTTTILSITVYNWAAWSTPSGLLVQFGSFEDVGGNCPTPVPSSSPKGPSIAPTSVPTSVPTALPSLMPTAVRFAVVINNLLVLDRYMYLILAEVQLFRNNVQVSNNSLTFTILPSINGNYLASNCNDGKLDNICLSSGAYPSLTIVSAVAFDKVVVYNCQGSEQYRIEGATITATVDGVSSSTTFPSSPDPAFTFVVASSGLEQYVPSKGMPFSVVINNLLALDRYMYLILAEVQLFRNNVQVSNNSLAFTILPSINGNYLASNCNDGKLDNICLSSGANPSLTIVSAVAFDKVVVYNCQGSEQYRIEGATITATVDGVSSSTTFPSSPDPAFTFVVASSGLQLYTTPIPTAASTATPAAPSSSPSTALPTHTPTSKDLRET